MSFETICDNPYNFLNQSKSKLQSIIYKNIPKKVYTCLKNFILFDVY